MKPVLLFYAIDDKRHFTLYPTLNHVRKSLVRRAKNHRYSGWEELLDKQPITIVRVYGQYDHKRKCMVRFFDTVSRRSLCSLGI